MADCRLVQLLLLLLLKSTFGMAAPFKVNTDHPLSPFKGLNISRNPELDTRLFGNSVQKVKPGWNRTNWQKIRNVRPEIVKVCYDKDSSCESDITWKNLTNIFQRAESVIITDWTKDIARTLKNRSKEQIEKYK